MYALFSDYILLKKELESKGGRDLVSENPDLEVLYEKMLTLENNILKKYGLPQLLAYRDILIELNTENDIGHVAVQLKNAAEYYLVSTPRRDVKLLEDAKANDLKTYEVLPEIGIDDTLHAMFYFEEYFKKDKITANELISILKTIDEDTSSKIGQFHYYTFKQQNLEEVGTLYKELSMIGIPFLDEFKNYRPVYPY